MSRQAYGIALPKLFSSVILDTKYLIPYTGEMTATGHAVIGTVIAAQFANPIIAIPLAIVSHIAADLFPHWDSGTNIRSKTKHRFFIEAMIDIGVGFILSYLIAFLFFPQVHASYLFLMIIAAQLLDWLWVPYKFLGWHFPPFSTALKLGKITNTKLDKPWGIILQIWVLLLLIGFAKVL